MGNKGAICVQFSVLGQQFQFINCHLAAHQHECERRNQTIHRILEEMVRNEGDVIFLGDLNYRIDMEKSQYR
jgi:inositol polyphosphate 5-phosphatase INPP5B/F